MQKYLAMLLAVICLAGGWRVAEWRCAARVERLQSEVKMLTRSTADWKNRAMRSEEALADLGERIGRQNLAIQRASTDFAQLQNELDNTSRKLWTERREWERREAQLMQPLPSDCDEAIREVIRRIQRGYE